MDQNSLEKSMESQHYAEDTHDDNERNQDSETPIAVVPDVSNLFKFDF